jgi:hypothetical protein
MIARLLVGALRQRHAPLGRHDGVPPATTGAIAPIRLWQIIN